MKKFAFVLALLVLIAKAAGAQTLALSPASGTYAKGQTFTVDIKLDTAGASIAGVDVYKLHFDPKLLQVVDADPNTAGVQVLPTTLLPQTMSNVADNAKGEIILSQVTNPGYTFVGSGVLTTITFQVVGTGAASVKFDFTPGSTTDCNIAGNGVDLLTSVTNASFTLNAQAINHLPIGSLEGGLIPGSTTLVMLGGWAVDPDSPTQTVAVNFTKEINGQETFFAQQLASSPRADLLAAGIGAHAFGMFLPDSLCDGRSRKVHAYAIDMQTNEQQELPHSPMSINCGSLKASASVTAHVTDLNNQPLTTVVAGATFFIFRISETGVALTAGNSSMLDANGRFSFTTDYTGEPFNAGDMVEVWAVAHNYIFAHQRIVLAAGSNNLEFKLAQSNIAADANGQAIVAIDPDNSQWLVIPGKVCNQGYDSGIADSSQDPKAHLLMQVGFVANGPTSYMGYAEAPMIGQNYVPASGCQLYNFKMPLAADLPDGQMYCATVSLGLPGQDPFTSLFGCAIKGIKQ